MKPRPIDIAPFRRLYPFTSRYAEVNGLRMHYVDEGRGEPLLMVHGNPTWSFYFRRLIQGLSGNYRAIAPDHIGCGLSARPGPAEYGFRLQNRVDDLEALLGRLGLDRNLTLVLHDWGGIIGMALAVRHPERIARLVLMNTAAFPKPKDKPLPLALKLVRNVPFLATPAVLGLNLFARAAARTASAKGLDPDVRKGLLAPYNNWRNRLATLRFVQDSDAEGSRLRPGGTDRPAPRSLFRQTGADLLGRKRFCIRRRLSCRVAPTVSGRRDPSLPECRPLCP
jgi:cis-3-alkyl-4-acyloxetan-2-one decarboxylase